MASPLSIVAAVSRRLSSVEGRHLAPGLAAFLAALAVALLGLQASADDPAGSKADRVARVQLLGVNDLHGYLESPQRRPGGAGLLGARLRQAAARHQGPTLTAHAGDMVGASPFVSSYFHDEPSVQAMNAIGFDVGTFGNHEFDEGPAEALRLIRGGRRTGVGALKRAARGRPVNTSAPAFTGARFPYVSANVVDRNGRPLLAPYTVVDRGGVKIGFIGVTTREATTYLLPRHAGALRFLDISDAVDRYVPALQRRGVQAIVVLAHAGGAAEHGIEAARGEIIDETAQMSDAVDVVLAGHTHSRLDASVANRTGWSKLIVQANSFGTAFSRVSLTIDRRSGHVLDKSAEIVPVGRRGAPHPRVAALTRSARSRTAPLAERTVGKIANSLSRRGPVGGLGAIAANAQRRLAGADLAFVNPGNMREDLDAGPVTFGDLFRVQAYEHRVLRMELTGAAVRELLEQQWTATDETLLHASGLRFSYDRSRPLGSRITGAILRDGHDLKPAELYTVAANELLADGPRFPALRDASGRRSVGSDLEALVEWFAASRARGRG